MHLYAHGTEGSGVTTWLKTMLMQQYFLDSGSIATLQQNLLCHMQKVGFRVSCGGRVLIERRNEYRDEVPFRGCWVIPKTCRLVTPGRRRRCTQLMLDVLTSNDRRTVKLILGCFHGDELPFKTFEENQAALHECLPQSTGLFCHGLWLDREEDDGESSPRCDVVPHNPTHK